MTAGQLNAQRGEEPVKLLGRATSSTTHRHPSVVEVDMPSFAAPSKSPFRGPLRSPAAADDLLPISLEEDSHGVRGKRTTPAAAGRAKVQRLGMHVRRLLLRIHRLPTWAKLAVLGVFVLASFLTPYFISEGMRQENLRWHKRTKVPRVDQAETLESMTAKYIAKERAQQVYDWEPEKRFLGEMRERQRPPDCSKARALVVKFSKFDNGLAGAPPAPARPLASAPPLTHAPPQPCSRWAPAPGPPRPRGSTAPLATPAAQWLVGAFTYAAVHGRTLVVASPDEWMWAPGCAGKTFECYFEPVSTCSEADVWPSRSEVLLSSLTEGDRVVYMNPSQYDWNFPDYTLNEIRACRHFIPYAWCRYWYMVPDHFRDRGVLWWKAQIARYLFKPLPRVLQAIQATKTAVQWELGYSPRICVHVRRGDKIKGPIAEALEVLSLETYAKKIAEVAEWFGARSVFVATDDPGAIAELRPLLPPGMRLLYDEAEERADGAGLKIRQGVLRDEAVQREIVTAAKNLALLSECDALVGTFTSWFSKFAYELKFARGSVHAVSLDIPLWYWQP
eukprot:tig00001254_g7818.t1